jgi:ATP-dependent Clp protease ATP-binding subunit ClpA
MHKFERFRLAAIKTINLGRRLALGCKWTPCAAQTAALARKEAAAMKHASVQDTHFTVALGHLGAGLSAEHLKYLGFQYERALTQAQAIVGAGTVTMESIAIPFSDGVRQIITVAQRLWLRDGLWYFSTDHLFLALLHKPEQLLQQLIGQRALFWMNTEKKLRRSTARNLRRHFCIRDQMSNESVGTNAACFPFLSEFG